jgi:hypothetical protein
VSDTPRTTLLTDDAIADIWNVHVSDLPEYTMYERFVSAARAVEVAVREELEREVAALRKDAERLDWIECNVMNGKLEIAQSIYKTGYEFGFWQQGGPRAIVKSGTLRKAIDAAMEKK